MRSEKAVVTVCTGDFPLMAPALAVGLLFPEAIYSVKMI